MTLFAAVRARGSTISLAGIVLCLLALLLAGCGYQTAHRATSLDHDASRARTAMPPGALPGLDEELWVITRAPEPRARDEDVPGSGALLVPANPDDERAEMIPVPLEHTDVRARIEAFVASVAVRQRFANPFDAPIEASYVFPLPQDAAITGFVMEIGERRIRAVLRDRNEAEATYRAARAAGHRAALLTQERPNVFTQAVANIEPGAAIDVRITYFHVLPHEDGWYEYVFPMVVGPRFNPPASPDPIVPVARGTGGSAGAGTTIPYLGPNERSGHDVDLEVVVLGTPVAEIASPSHDVLVDRGAAESSASGDPSPSALTVRLASHDRIPNRDFRLRFRTADETIRTALLVEPSADGEGGHFALVLQPPRELQRSTRSPVEMVFVIDRSGSMAGHPLQQARDAVLYTLDNHLREGDAVQVVGFSDDAEAMGSRSLEVTPEARRRVRAHVEGMQFGGGTWMLRGVRAALGLPQDVRERQRYVVLVTDGYIGNEAEVLAEIHRSLGSSRIFSLGVGDAPNRFLLTRMAAMGDGAVAFVGLNEQTRRVMEPFVERIAHPALSRIALDWQGADVADVHPERLPDLFVGMPAVITGRYRGEPPTSVRLSGDVREHRVETVVSARVATLEHVNEPGLHAPSAIPSVWARRRIASIVERGLRDPRYDPAPAIRAVALEHGLLSSVTAFVAVDATERVPGGGVGTPSMPVAVPVPRGVRYDTTVSAGAIHRGAGHRRPDGRAIEGAPERDAAARVDDGPLAGPAAAEEPDR